MISMEYSFTATGVVHGFKFFDGIVGASIKMMIVRISLLMNCNPEEHRLSRPTSGRKTNSPTDYTAL